MSSSPTTLNSTNTPFKTMPGEHDIICGKGTMTKTHPGNVRYRKIIENNKVIYAASEKCDKRKISMSIVKAVEEVGGRFLSQDSEGRWKDIGKKKSQEKVSQALREGQPQLVKALNGVVRQQRPVTDQSFPIIWNSSPHDQTQSQSAFGVETGDQNCSNDNGTFNQQQVDDNKVTPDFLHTFPQLSRESFSRPQAQTQVAEFSKAVSFMSPHNQNGWIPPSQSAFGVETGDQNCSNDNGTFNQQHVDDNKATPAFLHTFSELSRKSFSRQSFSRPQAQTQGDQFSKAVSLLSRASIPRSSILTTFVNDEKFSAMIDDFNSRDSFISTGSIMSFDDFSIHDDISIGTRSKSCRNGSFASTLSIGTFGAASLSSSSQSAAQERSTFNDDTLVGLVSNPDPVIEITPHPAHPRVSHRNCSTSSRRMSMRLSELLTVLDMDEDNLFMEESMADSESTLKAGNFHGNEFYAK